MKSRRRRFGFYPIAAALVVMLAIMTTGTGVWAADVVVVANKNVSQSALSADNLKAIFLGQMTTWQNGAKLEFVTLKDNSEVHEEFLKKFIGRSPAQFGNYWKQQVFTGKGRMPKQFDSESQLIDFVSSTEGAIGYVSGGAAKGITKVISIN
jgi:ABC-type phosphate transport system substrate-binding protein